MEDRRKWHNIFQVLEGRLYQPRVLYSAKTSFKCEGKIKTFSDDRKLREFVASRLTLKNEEKNSPNRKESIKKGVMEYHKRKNTISKNMGKCNRTGSWKRSI